MSGSQAPSPAETVAASLARIEASVAQAADRKKAAIDAKAAATVAAAKAKAEALLSKAQATLQGDLAGLEKGANGLLVRIEADLAETEVWFEKEGAAVVGEAETLVKKPSKLAEIAAVALILIVIGGLIAFGVMRARAGV